MNRATVLLTFSAAVLIYMVIMIYATFYYSTPLVSAIRELTMIPALLLYVVLVFLNVVALFKSPSRNKPIPWITLALHAVTTFLFAYPEKIL